jgi:transcription elongation factor S-II
LIASFQTGNKIRDTVRKKIFEGLGAELFPVELDRLYCAYAIEEGLTDLFKEVNQAYKDKSREILVILRDRSDSSFNAKLADGSVDPFSVASMSGMDLWSEQARKDAEAKIKYELEARRSDWQREQLMKTAKPGLFWCGKCKKNKTTYYQLQTRGADEPMTTFVVRIIYPLLS